MNKTRHRYLLGLQALAALVPFFAASAFSLGVTSSEDPGTTETDEEKKKREEKEKEEAAKKKGEEEKKKEDEEKKKEEQARAAASKPSLSACLAGALASLKGGTPALSAAALKQEQDAHAATKATLTQTQSDLTTVKASLASTETALGAVCAFLGIKPAEVTGLSAEKVNGVLQAKISAQAVEIVAGIGVETTKAPAPVKGDAPASDRAELLKQYNAINDAQQRAQFYAKHKDLLFGGKN